MNDHQVKLAKTYLALVDVLERCAGHLNDINVSHDKARSQSDQEYHTKQWETWLNKMKETMTILEKLPENEVQEGLKLMDVKHVMDS